MKNVTISMDEDLLSSVRIEAAKQGKSVSRYLSDMIASNLGKVPPASATTRNAQLEALERILSGPKWNVMRDGRMPTAEERNER